jgi:DNA-binding beta-propeller fold protein YncE
MTSSTLRRATGAALALAVGGTLAVAGPANAHPARSTASTVTSVPLVAGIYQSAYSARNRVLWVTAATGRPPVTSTSLLKVDPRTLAVRATYTPPVTNPETGAREAVYGVAVDDEHNTVWTTNTRDNSVAVYSQRTGKHLATLPGVAHAREVVVDERRNTAWATAFGEGAVVAFDTRTLKEKGRIVVPGAGPAGVAVDERTGTVYATDLGGDRIIEVTGLTGSPRFIPTGDGPISIALSHNGRTAYTADQAAGMVSAIDLRSGAVTAAVATGPGALSVAADPRTGSTLVANRTAGTLSIVDRRRGVVRETVPIGKNPNHVTIVDGVAYVVDKSGAGPQGQDQLHRIRIGR